MEKVTAIILAAGKGTRMGAEIPKQFMELDGKPLLYYSLKAFEDSEVSDIILVTNDEYMEYCQENIINKYCFEKIKKIIKGGTERYWSVWNGLRACNQTTHVLIHDAARPCITKEMIHEFVHMVSKYGCCTLGVPVKDTIKIVDGQRYSVDTPPRDSLWQVQTPQGFVYSDLVCAYEMMIKSEQRDITDDTMIMERFLHKKTKMIMGDYCNIKVTTPEDIRVVKNFVKI
ncbi:MAG: 2-C-methyl-D-erythritol 4-phosphate cytidylyltransferase [Eubacteriales bacterium]|nr:2-C-methyl-D-erythritol 4-phosphate cytidylyltransferase [Eubacteriales bacterium]